MLMLIGKLTLGTSVGHGVTVTGIRRRGAYTHVTLSTGSDIRLHKSAHVADLFIGQPQSNSLMDSHIRHITRVRAADPEWRGENVGHRGERRIARSSGHDMRALQERRVAK